MITKSYWYGHDSISKAASLIKIGCQSEVASSTGKDAVNPVILFNTLFSIEQNIVCHIQIINIYLISAQLQNIHTEVDKL